MSESNPAADVATATDVVIEREFNAPRELVWRAWTDPEHFVQWWGPHDFDTPSCTLDLRVGGRVHFCMRHEQMGEVWCGGVYQVIEPPARLVVTDYFADRDGNKVSPAVYGMPNHPEESTVSLTLEDLGNGRTKMTLRHGPLPIGVSVTVGDTEVDVRGGAEQGWSESFEKLAAYLAASV